MKLQKIAVLGAGAVGSYVLWGLSQKQGIEVCVVADGERKQRLQRDGIVINEKNYHPIVKTPKEAHGVDLLIVAVKYQALDATLENIKTIVNENTIVLSLMNGVDSEQTIAQTVGAQHVIPALIKIASERDGNSVRFAPESTIGLIYGESDPTASPERIEALNELFADTGLHYRATDVIQSEIWSKFRLNIANNLIQAIIGCGIGAYQDSEHAAFLKQKLSDEVDMIAAAKGIDISLADNVLPKGSIGKKSARYSTLQDLDAGRKTEIDMFSGAVIRMGKELSIPTPYNEFVYHMIKALEAKNDGLFAY